jgi:NitT/TauT family transport system substrate-binding protein
VEAIRANPASLRGQRVLITVNTTVDYVLQNCLQRWNLQRADLQVVNLNQAQILSAFSTGEGRIAGLWAPNIYTAEERMNAVPLCSGSDAQAIVPGNIIVREEFLARNPDMVARYLAVILRGIAWMKANPGPTLEVMNRFYQAGGPSQADRWFEGLSTFLAQVGTVQNPPAPSAFVTDEVLRRIADNPQLRAFALGQ